jgi:hypothetical protein
MPRETTKEYPDNCLKGVPREEWIMGKSVQHTLFIPNKKDRNPEGWIESSINWELDEGAIKILLDRKNGDGSFHFKGGVVQIPRAEIDRIIDQYEVQGKLSYEWKEEEDNKYHGNLLFHDSLNNNTSQRDTICGAFSKAVKKLIKQTADPQ